MATTKPKRPSASFILRATRNLLKDEGWRQFQYHTNGGGPRCVAGAISMAYLALRTSRRVLGRVYSLLEDVTGVGDRAYSSVESWNDDGSRTPQEVIKALTKAAALGDGKKVRL